VLVADLLTHTSGYDDIVVVAHRERRRAERPSVPPPAPGQDPEMSRLIHYAADAPLSKAPGEAAIYSNFNYELLGDIVSRVTRVSLAQHVESRIFEPLGAKDSFLVLPKELRENRRVFRQPGNLDIPQLLPWMLPIDAEAHDDTYTGAIGLKSTARDIGTFAQMLLNGGAYGDRRVLSAAAVRAMTSPQWPPGTPAMYSLTDPNTGANAYYPVRGGNWGYGLFLLADDDRSAYINGSLSSPQGFGHTGALGSYFWADPDADIVGVYLSVVPRPLPNGNQFFWRADHFQNMVHASVVD
jgi:CubicO group peptidase (beta-lactamase class C family)